ncbi:MAG: enolase C-terminal domain-like protein [Bryobacteraceae bacterium]|jgi:galactonate dehydratase
MPTNPMIARRRARLTAGFVPQFAAATPPAEPHVIAEIRWFPLREPVSGNRYAFVRVKTGSGLTGWGECGQASAQDTKALEKDWVGRPATLYAAIDGSTPLAGALDMALLDILGKACGAPIYRVLGGPTRNKVRAFSGSGAAPGFQVASVRVPQPAARNQGRAYQDQVRELLTQVGDDRDFVLDGRGRLTPSDAASVAATIEGSHPLWFDEPCSVTNLDAVRKISAEAVTPLGFGRGIADPAVFQTLLREGLVDVVRPDISVFGITGARRIAVLAETYYVAIAPHHDGGPVATAAALHLAASVPNFFIQHVPYPADAADRAMRAEIVSARIETARDGFLELPRAPGLGIDVNEQALEKYHAA